MPNILRQPIIQDWDLLYSGFVAQWPDSLGSPIKACGGAHLIALTGSDGLEDLDRSCVLALPSQVQTFQDSILMCANETHL